LEIRRLEGSRKSEPIADSRAKPRHSVRGSHSAPYGHFSTKCGQAERMLCTLHESSLRFRHNIWHFI
jgi:hypothetical protein